MCSSVRTRRLGGITTATFCDQSVPGYPVASELAVGILFAFAYTCTRVPGYPDRQTVPGYPGTR
eukprot:571837-Rhodomonas_salina.1